jgi:ubiquinone/menaquinone biosynthesis C-methylase UbiE
MVGLTGAGRRARGEIPLLEKDVDMVPAPLDSNQWHEAMVGDMPVQQIVDNINNGRNAWYRTILDATSPGDSLLELGCGTGVFSGILAKNGRKTTLLDYSEKSLDFCRSVFAQANLQGEFLKADVLKPFPYGDNTFDCVWSSGLLEHFTDEELLFILEESTRVSRKLVVSLVPNAKAIYYRLGKWYQESRGLWFWGKEDPKSTLKPFFSKAGLSKSKEFSVDEESAFGFLHPMEPRWLKRALLLPSQLLPRSMWCWMNQGYLLVTVGHKAPRQ